MTEVRRNKILASGLKGDKNVLFVCLRVRIVNSYISSLSRACEVGRVGEGFLVATTTSAVLNPNNFPFLRSGFRSNKAERAIYFK
jgi:hypothetical protein